jgi:aminocarboxymuconate-semialdehyde decarboxylase
MTTPPAFAGKNAIDLHSHVYLPRYADMLRRRATVPRIATIGGEDRLIILPGEDREGSTAAGRPIGSEYYDPARKLAYMDAHGIATSVISVANPWLDFLEPAEATPAARAVNEEMEAWCEGSHGRLRGLGVLPVPDPDGCVETLDAIVRLPHLRGVILGSGGLGRGLDDPALDPLWQAAEAHGLMIFIHPHYGVGTEHFHGTGHVLFLALGFTFETTIAVARLILAGALDRFPQLRLLVAHSGGTLPFLAGRLDGCVKTDYATRLPLKLPPSAYLKKLYYDAIAYHPPALQCLIDLVGVDRIMFGTDHPFFPPDLRGPALDTATWPSPAAQTAMIDSFPGPAAAAIYRDNARRELRL